MTAEIRAVAERLKGLRDMLDISIEAAASACGISPKEYMRFESGEVDIPLSVLFCMGKKYNVDMTSFISGEEPHHVSYFVTEKGKGITVNRRADYHYESLAYGFASRKADPFLVTINPGDISEIHYTTHPGQEFNYVIEGSLRIVIDGNEVILKEGDALYFDSSKPHGMQNADDKPCKFVVVIL